MSLNLLPNELLIKIFQYLSVENLFIFVNDNHLRPSIYDITFKRLNLLLNFRENKWTNSHVSHLFNFYKLTQLLDEETAKYFKLEYCRKYTLTYILPFYAKEYIFKIFFLDNGFILSFDTNDIFDIITKNPALINETNGYLFYYFKSKLRIKGKE
jgi:hypothetical protein